MFKAIKNPSEFAYDFEAFIVVDAASNEVGTFSTQKSAQKRADVLNDPTAPSASDLFFDDDTAIDYFATTEPIPEQEVTEEEAQGITGLVMGEQYHTGNIIQSGQYQYRVTKDSHYVSAKDAADMNEANDANAESGWYTTVEFYSGK